MTFAALLLAGLAGPTVEDLSWMSGYWLSCEDGREASETWTDARGGLMLGLGASLREGEASFEWMRIAPTEHGIAFVAQPGGAPETVFPAVEAGPGRAVFESPAHDFPQRVSYVRDGDGLIATIEGPMDGQTRTLTWTFRKTELNARCPA